MNTEQQVMVSVLTEVITERIVKIEQELSNWRSILEQLRSMSSNGAKSTEPAAAAQEPTEKITSNDSIGEAARKLIVAKGSPMRAKEILDGLKGKKHIGGKRPLMTLHATLRTSRRVRKNQDGSWSAQ